MSKDGDIINARIDQLFLRRSHTRYWITLVDDRYNHSYNFFFNIIPQKQRHRSIPLHSLPSGDLARLEATLTAIRHHTQLSIEIRGFQGLRWPSDGNLIQKRRRADEA
ncbi:acetyl-CoA carboxylase [Lacticaseibacillus thailandensis]|uniref:Acetyl-CoA carboxylase n=1 Tax=Lacticaseibacillus thailandensis DSM 22698 = JCM 13996 TaxID=1423810 RepID=A0A0R2C7X2_9LACO|nr:acetyl-CoA carboxylase [Lacticaseibacillus thailandensis]KRM87333.1 hypothetical protein FD19_GL000833 [Lacticaseibacillus thailandensis DSM 22698 = JCM 13996]